MDAIDVTYYTNTHSTTFSNKSGVECVDHGEIPINSNDSINLSFDKNKSVEPIDQSKSRNNPIHSIESSVEANINKHKLFPITQRFEVTPTLRRIKHSDSFPPPSKISTNGSSQNQPRNRLILNTPFSSRSTISYGLIVYAKDTQRWTIIQRKHSIEFLLFIRGLYRLTYLPLLLSQVTMEEGEIIRKCLEGGPVVFKDIYLKNLELDEKGLNYALIRMAESRTIAMKLLSRLDLSQNQLAWTWPKGRQSYVGNSDVSDRETPFACARREFIEEVEIKLPPPLFISDSYLSSNFHTLTGRNIESRFWIYVIPNEIPIPPIEFHPEVSNRLWVDTETCHKLIPNDNLFKQVIEIIAAIDQK